MKSLKRSCNFVLVFFSTFLFFYAQEYNWKWNDNIYFIVELCYFQSNYFFIFMSTLVRKYMQVFTYLQLEVPRIFIIGFLQFETTNVDGAYLNVSNLNSRYSIGKKNALTGKNLIGDSIDYSCDRCFSWY